MRVLPLVLCCCLLSVSGVQALENALRLPDWYDLQIQRAGEHALRVSLQAPSVPLCNVRLKLLSGGRDVTRKPCMLNLATGETCEVVLEAADLPEDSRWLSLQAEWDFPGPALENVVRKLPHDPDEIEELLTQLQDLDPGPRFTISRSVSLP